MAKIFWKIPVRERFIELYVQLEIDRPDLTIVPRATLVQTMMVDEGTMGGNQQRPVHNGSFIWSYREELEAARTALQESMALAREEQARKDATPVEIPKTPEEVLGAGMVQMVLKLLENQEIRSAIKSILVDATPVEPAVPEVPTVMKYRPNHAAPVKKKKILIIGLLGSQVTEIKKDFDSKFNLTFLNTDANHKRVKEHAESAALTIGMTGFMNHSVEAAAREGTRSGKKEYTRCLGTVTDLKRRLQLELN